MLLRSRNTHSMGKTGRFCSVVHFSFYLQLAMAERSLEVLMVKYVPAVFHKDCYTTALQEVTGMGPRVVSVIRGLIRFMYSLLRLESFIRKNEYTGFLMAVS